jgi:AcrR family transcriptional regulator
MRGPPFVPARADGRASAHMMGAAWPGRRWPAPAPPARPERIASIALAGAPRHRVPVRFGGMLWSEKHRTDVMLQKAPRRTRERILELSLRLFNEFGEPNITTTVLAEEMNISPGNLYYHFRNKDDIVNSIFVQFEAEISRILTVPQGRRSNIEDVWLYLHLMFELIWRYRFFYRDLNDLLSRNRKLELHFKLILAHKIKVARELCEDLRSEQSLQASDAEIGALATNMVVVATYWLSYEYVRNPRRYNEQQAMSDALARGCYQVLSLVGPYLRGDTGLLFEKLSQEYLKKLK